VNTQYKPWNASTFFRMFKKLRNATESGTKGRLNEGPVAILISIVTYLDEGAIEVRTAD